MVYKPTDITGGASCTVDDHFHYSIAIYWSIPQFQSHHHSVKICGFIQAMDFAAGNCQDMSRLSSNTIMNQSLIGGLEHVFFHILGISSSQLTFIFFKMLSQPPTRSSRQVRSSSCFEYTDAWLRRWSPS